MTRLTALSPADQLTPVQIAGTELSEYDPGPATLIALYPGKTPASLTPSLGLKWPKPNQVTYGQGSSLLWYGPDQALLLGAPCPELGSAAACTDLSDALCHLRLVGEHALAALTRLIPIDLRPDRFTASDTARSLLGKHPVSVRRAGPLGFDLMLPRSMAASAIAELTSALSLAASR